MRRVVCAASSPSASAPVVGAVERDAQPHQTLDHAGARLDDQRAAASGSHSPSPAASVSAQMQRSRRRRRRSRRRRRLAPIRSPPRRPAAPRPAQRPAAVPARAPSSARPSPPPMTTGRRRALDRAHGALISASIRSTARRAGRRRAGSMRDLVRHVSSARRMLASVMRFICGHRLHGRTNSIVGMLHGDVVAHRAFGDQHDPRRLLLSRRSRSSPRSSRRNPPPPPRRAGIPDAPAPPRPDATSRRLADVAAA